MTMQILLFGPDLPKTGVSTSCVVSGDVLRIAEHQQSAAFDQMRATVGGFDHDQLQLHWQASAGDFMVVPVDKQAQKTLIQQLQPYDIAGFSKWKVATNSQSAVWNSLKYGFGLLALMIVIGVWRYDDVLTFAANRVSIETEQKMGQAVLKSLNQGQSVVKTGPAVDFVKKVGDQLTKGSAYQYQWLVVRDDSINAFAMPGGIVVVNAGLLKAADNANEVAAVLAHEVQHVEQRHSLKNMINSAGIATVVMLVLGDANAAMIIVAHQVSTQFFSRHVEAEADEKGLALLLKSKINGAGMATFFKKLAKKYPQESNIPEWVSSHPDTQSRVIAAEQFVKDHPCQSCKKLTWDKPAILKSMNVKAVTNTML